MIKIISIFLLLFSISAKALILNLKNVEIKTLINTISMATGKNFVIDPRVKGRVNVISNRDIDNNQLYQVFLAVLRTHGFIVIKGDNINRILPKNLTKSESAIISGDDTIVTIVIKLENITALKLVPLIRPLMSQYGLLSVYTPNNSIIAVDNGSNISRLKTIITKLDKPVTDDFEFIKVYHADATQLLNILKSIFKKVDNAPNINLDKYNNQLIISGTESSRLKIRLLVNELDKKNKQNSNTSVVYLKYSNAKKILPILQNIIKSNSNQKNNKSSIQADPDTNSIIITGDNIIKNIVKDIIVKLDIRRAQVLIEAIIVEISLSSIKELGMQWILSSKNGIGFVNFNNIISSLVANATNVSVPGGANFVAGKFDKNTKEGFGLLISALNGTGNANILSTPSIVTLDNEEAEIVVGQEVPFITNSQLKNSSNNPFQNYERKNVGLTLKVKPQINSGDSIRLDISQEISSILPSSKASDLITSKRSLKTSVMVEDKKLLILGGLIDEVTRTNKDKIPFLGDIPILGALFSYNTESKDKRNLMIFIRPTILKNQMLTDSISMEKYNFIKAQKIISAIENIDNTSAVQQKIAKKSISENVIKETVEETKQYIESIYEEDE